MNSDLLIMLSFIGAFSILIIFLNVNGKLIEKYEIRNKPSKTTQNKTTLVSNIQKQTTTTLSSKKMAAIVSAVSKVTQGRGTVISINKIN